jgi:hypothetical protein
MNIMPLLTHWCGIIFYCPVFLKNLTKKKKMDQKLITKRVERIDEAIKAIKGSFLWSQTPQGYAYWAKVVENIEKLKGDES